MSTYDHERSGVEYQTAVEKKEYMLFSSLRPTLQRDGNRWCVLYGDNIQEGVCGFGESPHLAVLDFNENWYKKITNETPELFPGTLDQLNKLKVTK